MSVVSLGGAIWRGFHEQLPHALGQHGGFVGVVTGFQARWAIAVKEVDGKARGAFGCDQDAAEGARCPERVASADGD